MIRVIIGGAAAAALLAGSVQAAARAEIPKAMTLAWVITPTETGCRAEMEMTGRSGAVTPVTLFSDGQIVSLKFAKEDLPARAFLPIRIDRARFSNLMLRSEDGSGELVLSEETLAAMRKGSALGIAWLADEPLTAPLAGSEQGVADLRVCGAQTALQHRERLAAEAASKERAEADARAKALNEAQLAAVQAQAAAAEAQRRQIEDAARQQRQVDAQAQARADEEAQRQAYEDQRRRAYERQQQDVYDDDYEDAPRWQPPPPPRPYYPPRWSYPRY